ncbi:MAG: hypothetical protein JST67_10865 [Bacteroidetes bacterium]|nr:hypothetical protein [Bacteroidota bacterium]
MKTNITKTAGKTAKTIATAFAACALIFSSCQKGATGPQGPAGTNGAANISSSIYTITPGTWSAGIMGGYTASFSDASITNPDKDAIQVYVSGVSSGYWLAIPGSNLFSNGDNMTYSYISGQIALDYYGVTSAPSSTIYAKVVVIPPTQRRAHPHVNYNNYNEVKAVFNLKD